MQPVNANEHVKVHLSISIYTWKTGRSIGNGGANQRCLHALVTLYFYPLYYWYALVCATLASPLSSARPRSK